MSIFSDQKAIKIYPVHDLDSLTESCKSAPHPLNITNGSLEVVLSEYSLDKLDLVISQMSVLSKLRCFIVFRDLTSPDFRFFCYYIFEDSSLRKRLNPYVTHLLDTSDGSYFIESLYFCSKSYVMDRILFHLNDKGCVLEKKFLMSG